MKLTISNERKLKYWMGIFILFMASFALLLASSALYFNLKEKTGIEGSATSWIDSYHSLKLHKITKIDDNRGIMYIGKGCAKLEGLWGRSYCTAEGYVFLDLIGNTWKVNNTITWVWER
jgi:hypothetical protein